jgi:beta-phosphoglucomutase
MIKGVLFDFNGVLLLDTKWHMEAWNDLSMVIRNVPMSHEEESTQVHGRTPDDTLKFLLGRDPNVEERKIYLDRKEKLYQEVCLRHGEEFALSPGATDLLSMLEQQGIKKTIATSSPLVNVKFYYEHLGLEKWFPWDSIVFADGTFPGKPAPDIFIKAAEKIGIPRENCMVIEDAGSGVAAAKAAGVGKIILLKTEDNKGTELKVSVDKAVERLDQITIKDLEESA